MSNSTILKRDALIIDQHYLKILDYITGAKLNDSVNALIKNRSDSLAIRLNDAHKLHLRWNGRKGRRRVLDRCNRLGRDRP